jgi:hypothetical protein
MCVAESSELCVTRSFRLSVSVGMRGPHRLHQEEDGGPQPEEKNPQGPHGPRKRRAVGVSHVDRKARQVQGGPGHQPEPSARLRQRKDEEYEECPEARSNQRRHEARLVNISGHRSLSSDHLDHLCGVESRTEVHVQSGGRGVSRHRAVPVGGARYGERVGLPTFVEGGPDRPQLGQFGVLAIGDRNKSLDEAPGNYSGHLDEQAAPPQATPVRYGAAPRQRPHAGKCQRPEEDPPGDLNGRGGIRRA